MKKRIVLSTLVVFAALLYIGLTLHAQQATGPITPTQQTATRADAAINVLSSATSAQTVSVTPPNGQYVYIMGADVSNCGNATGVTAAAQTNITTANLNGLTWQFSSGTGAGACAQTPIFNFGPGGLKSALAGTVTSFTLPTFAANQTIRLNVYYTMGY